MNTRGGTDNAPARHVDDALFRPVRAGNAFEETVERLLQTIKLGVVDPGERLPTERDLAGRFNVSRVTLREAIRALQHAGYVESRRGRYGGTFVTLQLPDTDRAALAHLGQRTRPHLEDALTTRYVLETGIAETAAARELHADERAHLRDRHAEAAAADTVSYRRLDSRLHLAMAEVTTAPTLTSSLADVRMRVNEFLDAIPLLERNIEHANEQHDAIVAAILDRDPDTARAAMADHLAGTAALLRGFLG